MLAQLCCIHVVLEHLYVALKLAAFGSAEAMLSWRNLNCAGVASVSDPGFDSQLPLCSSEGCSESNVASKVH